MPDRALARYLPAVLFGGGSTMRQMMLLAGFAILLGACVYTPTPGPTVAPRAGGYTLNDNGYQAYYATDAYSIADCKSDLSYRCQDRLDYDDAFCANWTASGRCGDSTVTTEPSREISPRPAAGRGWLW